MGQETTSIERFSLFQELLGELNYPQSVLDTTFNKLSLLSSSDSILLTAFLFVIDTGIIDKIDISIGTDTNSFELINTSIFIKSESLNNYPLKRGAKSIRAPLGVFPYFDRYYCRLSLLDTLGVRRDTIYYHTN